MTTNQRLDALLAGARGVDGDEPDPNVTPLVRPSKGTFIGKLRPHFHIQVNHDVNDPESFVHGPCEIALSPRLAIAHLTKFENVNEIKEWLAREHPKAVAGKPWLAPRSGSRRPSADVPRGEAMRLADRTLAQQLAAAESEVARLRAMTGKK